jgi:hypothetical protein
MLRSRVFLVSCLLAALALCCYGLQRWPVERVTTYRRAGSDFVKSADPVDRVLGTADYLAAALLFGVWPWVWIRRQDWKKRWRPSDEKQSSGHKVEGIVVTVSLFCALFMGLMSIGAVISLFRS